MDAEKHLKYFKVENFKAFESLELNDIGQFNLIAGDNNVGKTSILEALLFDESLAHFNSGLYYAFMVRYGYPNNINGFDYYKYYYNKKSHSDIISYYLSFNSNKETERIKYELEVRNIKMGEIPQLPETVDKKLQNILKYQDRFIAPYISVIKKNNEIIEAYPVLMHENKKFIWDEYSPFIPYGLGYSEDLVKFYAGIQASKISEDSFIKSLSVFFQDIEEIKIRPTEFAQGVNEIAIRIKGVDGLIPLPMFGEGANKLLRILAEIQRCKGERLMIDEIDTGVHYSRFKLFWKTIIKSAIDNDVQIFATTHNFECLKYFKEALEDEEMKQYQKDARHFLVEKLNDGGTKAYTFNFSQFESAIDLGNEIRGGK